MTRSVVCWLLCALVLAACGSAAPASAPPASPAASARPSAQPAPSASALASGSTVASRSAAATGKITFAYTQVSATFLPVFYAQEAGLFKRNGLDVDLQLTQSAAGMAALLLGQINMSAIGGTELLNAASSGGDVVALANIGPLWSYQLEVQPEIKTAADLKGKKIGITQFGSSVDIATRVALRTLGLAPTEVNILPLTSASARAEAMLNHAIDGGLSTPPDTLTLEAHGMHVLLDMASTGVPASNILVVSKRSWVTGHRDQAQAAIDALIQSLAGMKKDKTQALSVLSKYTKYDDRQGLEATYDYYVNHVFPAVPLVNAGQFKDVIEYSTEPKVKTVNIAASLDNSLVQSAVQRGLDKS